MKLKNYGNINVMTLKYNKLNSVLVVMRMISLNLITLNLRKN